jgi:hypothetical protein
MLRNARNTSIGNRWFITTSMTALYVAIYDKNRISQE